MKIKSLFIIASMFFMVGTVSAQEFSIGPKIGLSQGNVEVNGDGFSKGNSKMGYHVGLFSRFGGKFIYLQPDVLYTHTGGEFTETVQREGEVTYEATFIRLHVPVMAGFELAYLCRVKVGPVP